MKVLEEGTLTSPRGFLAAGVACGIKKKGKPDLALVCSETPCAAAGVFTRNVVAAAPVGYCREVVGRGTARALVVNAGNANACTGAQGEKDTLRMAELAGKTLGVTPAEVLVSSTGVIGVPLPMEKIGAGIAQAAEMLSPEGGPDAARAILTTDTFAKHLAVRITIGDREVTVGGIAKGSGMIHPDMATMLGFVTTDCAIGAGCLQDIVADIAERTFNMITVDGDTSTNDMLLCLANGQAGNRPIHGIADEGFDKIYDALYYVCRALAIEIVRDGEGATKLISVNLLGAASEADARTAAKSVCGSNLVKTAMFGQDANWGRILAAVGYSGIRFDPSRVSIRLSSAAGEITVAEAGAGIPFSEEEAARILTEKEIVITVDLAQGDSAATAWCCDLSYDYVRINADYRS